MTVDQEKTAQPPRCTYCGATHKDKSTMTQHKIIQRDNRAPRGLRESMPWFCKNKGCGGNYQMGCEG